MDIIAEVRRNNESWKRSVFKYVETALLNYASAHDTFSSQSIRELSQMINVNYSTHVSNKDLDVIAEELPKISNIKNRLAEGDITLVKEISNLALTKGSGKSRQSFASKLCYMYNRDKFPIYDSFAREILVSWHNNGKPNNEKVKSYGLDYVKYVQIYLGYQCRNGLQEFTLWQIDKYFWVKGKQNNGTAFMPNSLIKL